jgi:hypothetical protein
MAVEGSLLIATFLDHLCVSLILHLKLPLYPESGLSLVLVQSLLIYSRPSPCIFDLISIPAALARVSLELFFPEAQQLDAVRET